MRPLLVALGFLTRLPVPVGRVEPAELGRALGWFPWVGVALGAALAGLFALCPGSPLLIAALAVASLALVTGGLHLDGLADTADGLGGGRGDRERTLAVMRDPRTGAHGVAAVALVLLIKTLALADAFTRRGWAALVFPAVGRLAAVAVLAIFAPARADGLAHAFRPKEPWALGLAALPVAALALWGGPVIAAAAAVALAGAFGVAAHAARRIGGTTGDVCGAAVEVAEALFLVVAALRV